MVKVKIGLEVHVQLNTNSKLFCSCPASGAASAEPNSRTCPTCLGHPGAKPVLNEAVLGKAMRLAIALNCNVQKSMFFSRKAYFYPDMSKNYQITQYEIPFGKGGWLEINASEGKRKKISIQRMHIEEDPAKLVHSGGDLASADYTLIDYNRSGMPLVEIVTEPDFENPREARIFLQHLRSILEYIDVFDTSASIKADANVSINGGERVEIKNVTGFVEVEKALTDEIIRQKWLAEDGKKVERETRAWLPEKRSTITLRKKESEEDYGYIFEPDLTMVCIEDEWLEETRKKMPELPHQKLERYIKEFEISREQAASIVADLDFALLFEQVAKQVDAKLAASWMNVLKKTLFYNDLEISQTTLTAGILVKLIGLISAGKLTDHGAEMILRELLADASKFDELVSSYSRSDSMVNSIVKGVLSSNDKAVLDYHAGNVKALQFLIGEVVKKSGRRVDARAALEALKKELG